MSINSNLYRILINYTVLSAFPFSIPNTNYSAGQYDFTL